MLPVRGSASRRMHSGRGRHPGWPVLILLLGVPVASFGQMQISQQELAELRRTYLAGRETQAAAPHHAAPVAVADWLTATRVGGAGWPADQTPSAVDLYRGLKPSGNGFWLWTLGGAEVVYWALDDGVMGPAAVAVGGGQVESYEFSFAVHADFPGDTLRPFVVVSFYNAPPDPVAGASDPVVEPPSPVSSVGWIFDPITLPARGFYALRTGMIDLATLGLDFGLDESFYVEIVPLEWSSYPDGSPVFDPDVSAVFTGPGTVVYGMNQDRMWSDLWVRAIGDCGSIVLGNGDGKYQHPAEMDPGGCSPFLNQSGIILAGTECPGPTMSLNTNQPADVCVRPGEPVTVRLLMSCVPGRVRGFQAFLSFDPAALTFVSGSYTSEPFGLPILYPITANGPDIDLAAGIDDLGGQDPTSTSAHLVTLDFIAGSSDGLTTVAFRPHEPPTRFSDEFGGELGPALLVDSPTICVDNTPPVINCPSTQNVQCPGDVPPAALTYAQFEAQGGSASDSGCDPDITFSYVGDVSDGQSCPETITRTYRAVDCAGNVAECQQLIIIDDTTPPLIVCPADVSVKAAAGGCTASVNPGLATASDNCDPSVSVEYKRSDRTNWNEGLLDPYPAGVTTVTWRATDDCGNTSSCDQIVAVTAVNELVVTLELDGFVESPLTRCVTFELWNCGSPPPVVVSVELTFIAGLAGATVDVPCGTYECVTVRDDLHTLRRTLGAPDFQIVGTQYVADFVTPAKALIGGNLNDDQYVDILDFGVFAYQWLVHYDSDGDLLDDGHTPCGQFTIHADISGNGVVHTEDFTFIQINFLERNETDCCAQPDAESGPVTGIPVATLRDWGMSSLAAGDLNQDGRLDESDMAAFLAGARPAAPASNAARVQGEARPLWPAR